MTDREHADMKISSPQTSVIGIALVLLLLLLCVWPLLGQFWVFERRIDVDIHSGDFRKEVAVFRLRITEKISTSEFSTEVRRLGLQTSEKPAWKFMSRQGLGRRHRSSDYLGAYDQMNLMVRLLDALETPDEERKAILEAALQSLQAGQPDKIRLQLDTLAEHLPDLGCRR